ncbi:MAG: sterol desaturase family protein, partial [Nevskiales bacterium]
IKNMADPVALVVVLVGTVWGFFIHANLRWRFGPLEWLLATPPFHHWHHTNDANVNHNYSTMLPWMDWIFGTYYMPRDQWPPSYGIDEKLPDAMADQLLYPLLPRNQPAGRLDHAARSASIDASSRGETQHAGDHIGNESASPRTGGGGDRPRSVA